MPGIDPERPFHPVRIAVLTVSDSRGLSEDRSGDTLVARATAAGHEVVARAVVKDEIPLVQAMVRSWIDDPQIDVVLTTGGTGVTGRDITPEAVESLYEKAIPGFGELFRWQSFATIGTSTIQSRATAGVSGGTYIFALPGSPGACRDAWDGILQYQLDSRYRPCNFVEIMPRLQEHLRRGPG